MIKNFEELAQLQAVCTATMSDKFSGKGEKRAIVLCGGTGCLSSNSMEIKEKFEKLIADKAYLEAVMKKGADEAAYYARKTLSKVRRKLGFVNL